MNPPETTPTWRSALTFFCGRYLPRDRGLSPRTQASYATSLRLWLSHLGRGHAGPHEATVSDVLAFLESLEEQRENAVSTRNLRLAALRSFWKAMLLWDAPHRERYEHLLQVPLKRCTHHVPDYLERDELARLFAVPDPATHPGFRDLTLLRYMYNTGSRISEVAEARTSWLSLAGEPEVRIVGKGGKARLCPLWQTTAQMLRVYLQQERVQPKKGFEEYLFLTRRGSRFTRGGLWRLLRGYLDRAADGSPTLARKRLTPHSLRHTTAVHLLRARVEMNVIKAWLGHADVSTTSHYLDLGMDQKREALERFARIDVGGSRSGSGWGESPLPQNLIEWLERL